MEEIQNQTTAKPILYQRFDRSFGFEFVVLAFLCPPLVALWAAAAYYYIINGAVSIPIVRVAVYCSAAFAIALLLYGNSRAIRRRSGVVLDGEGIVRRSGGTVGLVEYADIRDVRCTRNPLFSKKMAVATAAGVALLPLNLRGSHKMVETVFKRLSAGGQLLDENTERVDGTRQRLYVAALRYNALYRLRGRHFWNLTAVAFAAAALNALTALYFWERGALAAMLWGFAGMLFQTLGYFAAERLWALRSFGGAEADNSPNIDILGRYSAFKAIHATAAVAALLVGMAAGIAVTQPAIP